MMATCVKVITTLLLLTCVCQWHTTDAAAVMSVDLGTEWMKVGVVSPGVPMEIALNRESKRKTPAILAFRDNIRTFGEDAMTVGIRDPTAAYGYLLDLLGKSVDNPIVDLYRKRFPYYDIIPDPVRNTVIFKKSDNEEFSVEELIAQMLTKAKEFAQESTLQPISECVLIVPGYFGQAEREALLAAAQLANLKVLQLINDYTAVALNYGVFHRAEINETSQYFIFYDMGAYKTSAALVSYQLVKDKLTKETNPVVQVLGVGYDRTLGGLEVQLRLRDYLAAEFNALKKTKTDVTTSPRALAKLFKEAGRVKNVLSANNEHYAQIENLLEDHDFKVQVTREKLEELCADLWPRATKPLEDAIASSGLSLDVVSQVIIFGGGTRVPKVQDTIKQLINQELGKSLNADEAPTMGAVYKAADLATGFKVKKFIVKDAVVFPLHVSFERDPGDGSGIKLVKRLLFGSMNPYPQKKVITFNKHTEDFDFVVYYGDLSALSEAEIAAVGSLNITKIALRNVKEMLEKTKQDVVEAKGIKAYFVLDDSGIFRCTGVEYVYEKQKQEEEDESTLSKLGSTISKLFTKEDDAKAEKDTDKKDEAEKANDGREPNESTNGKQDQAKETDNEKKAVPDETKSNEKLPAKDKNDTVKLVTIKVPVAHTTTLQFTQQLAGDAYEKSLEKLTGIHTAEQQRTRLESAFNALESHVIEVQQKLGEDSFASCCTDSEKEALLAECAKLSDWLYEDITNPTPEIYEKKLKALKKISNVFLARHWEHDERPDALKALNGMVESALKFLITAKNLTKETNPDNDIFTQVEVDTLAKVIEDTVEWQQTETDAQALLERHADVRLTVKDISDKMALLDREVKYLVNKIKIWKPKVKPTKKASAKKKSDNAEKSENDSETEAAGAGGSGDDAIKIDTEQEPIFEQLDLPVDDDTQTTKPTPVEERSTPHSEL